jgi:serpin B
MSDFMAKLQKAYKTGTQNLSTFITTSVTKSTVPMTSDNELKVAGCANKFNDDMLSMLTDSQHISSPLSIYMLMTLVNLGASGKSFDELFDELVQDESMHNAHTTMIDVVDTLQQITHQFHQLSSNPDNRLELEIANDFYVAERFQSHLSPDFKHHMKKLGDITPADFANATATAKLINSKVDTKTRGMITQLIEESDISSDTKLILVNCLYFNPVWQHQFEEYQTRNNTDFTSLNNSVTQGPMMSQTEDFNYYENEQFQMVTLPYKNGQFVMDVVLPKTNGMDVTQVNSQRLMDMVNKSDERNVELYLPRFEQNTELEVVNFFKQLGVTDIFTSNADFSNMVTADSTEELFVDKIIHKAVIKVDEKGTKAAAATAVVMNCESYRMPTSEPIVFNANHTFRYFIRYVPNNLVLFSGQYDGQ